MQTNLGEGLLKSSSPKQPPASVPAFFSPRLCAATTLSSAVETQPSQAPVQQLCSCTTTAISPPPQAPAAAPAPPQSSQQPHHQQPLLLPAQPSPAQPLPVQPSPCPVPPSPVQSSQQPRSPAPALCSPPASSHAALVAPAHMVPVPSPVPISLSHSQPAQRVTSVLLNGKNFHTWSRSFQLYLGGKRKTRWILGKEPKHAESDPSFDEWVSDNCIILGWMFNSMEDRVYHMFMYHDTVHGLCPDTRWEELAQYESLSDFPSDGAVESKRLDRRHTYQFLMGLKSEFETPRTQILNTSPLPSLYEAFAIVNGDERSGGGVVFYHLFPYLSPLLLFQTRGPLLLLQGLTYIFFRPRGGGRSGGRGSGTPRTAAIAEVEPIPADLPDFKQLQLQLLSCSHTWD
ncbi:hypothetical protein Acr_01g0007970 [Actinidia rufa]|uniref:Retrotransposon Copia-like N-terminal domain-containing protein n=1 Tax=Actinidia rufa TaxID=165716 RepID=A0A7J0E3G6_9ERIC|nr:hypothetical protein Acr_01g0007970 [Actinidia rufa]